MTSLQAHAVSSHKDELSRRLKKVYRWAALNTGLGPDDVLQATIDAYGIEKITVCVTERYQYTLVNTSLQGATE